MTIANINKPWSFTNNTETADASKVNQNFDSLFAVLNEVINAINAAAGSQDSIAARLSVSFNDDGTLKGGAIPIGTYDPRTIREVSADTAVDETDSILWVDNSAGPIVITLPEAATALVSPTIICGSSSGYAITISPNLGDTVMGLDTVELSVGGESIKITPEGSNWWRSG